MNDYIAINTLGQPFPVDILYTACWIEDWCSLAGRGMTFVQLGERQRPKWFLA